MLQTQHKRLRLKKLFLKHFLYRIVKPIKAVYSRLISTWQITRPMHFDNLKSFHHKLAFFGEKAQAASFKTPEKTIELLKQYAEILMDWLIEQHILPVPLSLLLSLKLTNQETLTHIPVALLRCINLIEIISQDALYSIKTTAQELQTVLEAAFLAGASSAIIYKRFSPELLYTQDNKQLEMYNQTVISTKTAQNDLNETIVFKEILSTNKKKLNTSHLSLHKQRNAIAALIMQASTEKFIELAAKRLLRHTGWDINSNAKVAINYSLPIKNHSNKNKQLQAHFVLWTSNTPAAILQICAKTENISTNTKKNALIIAQRIKEMHGHYPITFIYNGVQLIVTKQPDIKSFTNAFSLFSANSLKRKQASCYTEQQNKKNKLYHLLTCDTEYKTPAVKKLFKNICEDQSSFIVMPPGTGKTAKAIALIELTLQIKKNDRFLMLCLNNLLCHQAHEFFRQHDHNFNSWIIDHNPPANEKDNIQLYLASYSTILASLHRYDCGFFDCIIADDINSKVFRQFEIIFSAFCCKKIAFSSEPLEYIDSSLFYVFNCEPLKPTFHMSYQQAINHFPAIITPYRVREVQLPETSHDFFFPNHNTHSTSIKNNKQLTSHHRTSPTLLFNNHLREFIIHDLLYYGLTNCNQILSAKTIIFTQTTNEAETFVKSFYTFYPQYNHQYCQVIPEDIAYYDEQLLSFKSADSQFFIAVTAAKQLHQGFEAPELVNIVLAFPIADITSLWLLIGQGFQLCPNLYGTGAHKTHCLILDYCYNFSHYNLAYTRAETFCHGHSLTEHLFEQRLAMLNIAIAKKNQQGRVLALSQIAENMSNLPKNCLHLSENKQQLKALEEACIFAANGNAALSDNARHLLDDIALPLMRLCPVLSPANMQFDRLILYAQTDIISQCPGLKNSLNDLILAIKQLPNSHPSVKASNTIIKQYIDDLENQNLSIEKLEKIRLQLRDLMQYRDESLQLGFNHTSGLGQILTDTPDLNNRKEDAEHQQIIALKEYLKCCIKNPSIKRNVPEAIYRCQPFEPEALEKLILELQQRFPLADPILINKNNKRPYHLLYLTLREFTGIDIDAVEHFFSNFHKKFHSLTNEQHAFINDLKHIIAKQGLFEISQLYNPPLSEYINDSLNELFSPTMCEMLFQTLNSFLKITLPSLNQQIPTTHDAIDTICDKPI